MFFYFKKFEVVDAKNVPQNKPVLFLCNHQNGLIDPLLIALSCNRFAFFLTRASVFKSSFVAKLLRQVNMIPVYRVRDGLETIPKNKQIFKQCASLLEKGEVIVIFPEGSHLLKRTVRPLSKGFTRIISKVLEENIESELQLQAVGLNFQNPKSFPDCVSVHYGEPIKAKQYANFEARDFVLNLKHDIHSSISKLTTYIPLENYDNTLKKLVSEKANFLDPIAMNNCINSDFNDCNFDKPKKSVLLPQVLKPLLILNFIMPYLIWKMAVLPRIKEPEFIDTFRFALMITLAPLWLFLILILFAVIFGWQIGISYVLVVIILSLAYVKT